MLNKETLDLIKASEGLRLYAYLDPVNVWTIGYGHTSAAGAPKVTKGMRISKQEAEAILKADLERIYIPAVKRNVRVPLNENQLGALVSFTYNLGETNLKGSTLLRKLNKGDYTGASKEFSKWVNAGGKKLPGLVTRREAERRLFLKPVSYAPVYKDYDVDEGSGQSFIGWLLGLLFGRR